MSRKIVPPVTPRIVRDNPRKRFLLAGLSIIALLLTAWFSYDYGRSTQPLVVDSNVVVPTDSAERIEQLEQERDALRQQVAELQQGMEQANQSLGASQARIQALQEALSATDSPQEVVTPTVIPAAAETASEAAAAVEDDALLLGKLEIEPTESADTFRLRFLVRHSATGNERITGNIWIAVNGMMNRKPRRLSLKALSPEKRAYVKMGFDQQQEVVEDVVLPAEFVPKNILVEVKPYGDRFSSLSKKFSWETGGR